MMDCTDITRFLHAYIDQEFEHREEIEFEHHLLHCDSCRQEVAYYRSLRRTLRAQVEREVAPVRLEASIMHALEEEDNNASMGWFSLSLATAGAFLCALGIFLWAPSIQDATTAQNSSPAPPGRSVALSSTPQPRGSAVVAPLSVRSSVPTRHNRHQLIGPNNAQRPTQAAYVQYDPNEQHAGRAVISLKKPQRCLERQREGWFFPSQRGQGSTSNAIQKAAYNDLDDLCDPPRQMKLIRANFQR